MPIWESWASASRRLTRLSSATSTRTSARMVVGDERSSPGSRPAPTVANNASRSGTERTGLVRQAVAPRRLASWLAPRRVKVVSAIRWIARRSGSSRMVRANCSPSKPGMSRSMITTDNGGLSSCASCKVARAWAGSRTASALSPHDARRATRKSRQVALSSTTSKRSSRRLSGTTAGSAGVSGRASCIEK